MGLQPEESLIKFLPVLLVCTDITQKDGTHTHTHHGLVKQQQSEEKGAAEGASADEEERRRQRRASKAHLAKLKKELRAEQEKRAALEEQVEALRRDEDARGAQLEELQRAYGALEEEYAVLLRESAQREKELEELRQTCDVTRSRMARQMAQVSEMVGASKYSIQTNAQKVQQLESHVRDLVKANRSVLTHVVLPYVLKWVLAAMSFLLFCVSQLVRGAKALFARRDQASRTLLAAETYVQSALLWMQSLQQRQQQQLGDASATPPLVSPTTPTTPLPDALLPAAPLPLQQENAEEEEAVTDGAQDDGDDGGGGEEEEEEAEACLLHRTGSATDS